jgi:hypothetical protein
MLISAEVSLTATNVAMMARTAVMVRTLGCSRCLLGCDSACGQAACAADLAAARVSFLLGGRYGVFATCCPSVG